MNKWLQIVAGAASVIVAVAIWFGIIVLANPQEEGMLLMAMVAVLSIIAMAIIVHRVVGWRHYWIGVLGMLGLAILAVGGCFAFVIYALSGGH